MLRHLLASFRLSIGDACVAEAKRLAVLAGALLVVVISGALTINLALAAAVYLAFEPLVAPAWAALFAAGAALALASIVAAAIYWQSGRARRRARRAAAARMSAETQTAALLGSLAAAFVTGVASGMDRRRAPGSGNRA